MVGSAIGPYQVIGMLGAGGMGEVFLGHDPRLQRHVALKSLTAAKTPSGELHARILREARAAARLNHPNIAAVYDVLDVDDGTFIVMEYVPGDSLAERVARGPMPIDQVRAIGRQLASALTAAHAQGVIHRDLKPANIHLTHDGSIKVLDFGVAKLSAPSSPPGAETTASLKEVTIAGNPGTPIYMSPEQLMSHPIDGRSDIYSAGVILYQLATGRRPYQAIDAVSLAMAMASAAPPRASTLNPEVPADLDDAIARALEREPAKRFQSAGDLQSALTPTETAKIGTTVGLDVPRPRVPRKWWVSTAAAVVAVLLVGFAAWTPIASWRGLRSPATVPDTRPVLAILSVDYPKGDAPAEYLGAALTSIVADNFGSLPALTVLSRASTADYETNRGDLTVLRRELGATFVFDLSLRTVAPAPHVAARLFRTAEARPIWDETIQGDALTIQKTVLEGLGQALERSGSQHFTADEWSRLRRLPTTNAAALMAYSEARALLDRPEAPDVDRAIALLTRAADADPAFVIAWAGLGDAWWAKYQNDKEPGHAARATDAVRRALALDPNRAAAYSALANVQFRTGRLKEAEASLRLALQLQPGLDDAPRRLAQVIAGQGRVGEAETLLHQVIRRSPNWSNLYMLGTIEYLAGRYREAVDAFKQATDARPNHADAFLMLGTTYYILGDLQLAVGNFEHAVRLGPSAAAHANLGLAYYDSGRFEDALHAYEQALQLDPRRVGNHRNIGDVYGRLGRVREARREYERAIELGGKALAVNQRDAPMIALMALCEAKLGNRTSAERHAAEAVAVDAPSREVWQKSAEVHALLNQPEAALHDLEAAVARGFEPRMARRDDELASIRKLPRFEEILRAAESNAVKK